MKPRHPIQGLDAEPTSNARHASEADQIASLLIAIVAVCALALLTAVIVATK